jgi:hypothetical protein
MHADFGAQVYKGHPKEKAPAHEYRGFTLLAPRNTGRFTTFTFVKGLIVGARV